MNPRLRLVAACCGALLLAACGSTVQQSQQLSGGNAPGFTQEQSGVSPSDPVTSDPGTTASTGSGQSAPGAAEGGPAPVSRSSSGTVTTPSGSQQAGSGPGSGSASSPASLKLGPGADQRSVRVGFQFVDVGSGTSGFLGKDVSLGDPKAQAKAVADWINAHGGVGGRKLVLDIYGVPYADYLSNAQAAFTRICAHYTQDVKVLGVAVYVPDRTLVDCLAKHDVISVSDGYSLDRQSFTTYDKYYWSPGSMSQDRGAEVGVDGLFRSGFLPKTAKIGLLRYDEITYARAEVSLRKALSSRGLKVETTHTVSYASASQAESDASAAVLDFRARGITHVMVLDNSGGITYAFMQAAESQQYRPFYALTTNNSPQALQQLAPAGQLAKAQAISWWSGDVGTRVDQATPPKIPSSRDSCLAIMKKAGVDTSGSAAGSSLITCDQLLLLKAVLDKAAAPNSSAMTAALNQLGSSYSSPLSYASTFGPGRHDAASLTRRIRFDSGCSCWLYAGSGPTA